MTLLSIPLLTEHPDTISVGGMAHNLLWVTVGNIIGGSLFMGIGYWVATHGRFALTKAGRDLAQARAAPPNEPPNEGLATASPTAKTAVLFFVILGVIVASFTLAVWLHEDADARVQFRLNSHDGETLTATDLGGRHLMVFFGFTNCHMICPTQMNKLTQVMAELDQTGHGTRITPVFISVDPERDTPAKVAAYLEHFDERFVGLTGSRAALKSAADSFKTLFEALPPEPTQNHQINHSTVVYIVDPFSRIVDYLPGSSDHLDMAARIRDII